MPISWINPEELVEFEFVQAEEEGRDVARFIQEWDEHRRSTDDVAQLRRKAESLMDQMAAAASGGVGLRTTPAELPAVLREINRTTKPVLIDLKVDPIPLPTAKL